MTHLIVGKQTEKCIDMGPLVDASQLRSVTEYVDEARREGAQVRSRIQEQII